MGRVRAALRRNIRSWLAARAETRRGHPGRSWPGARASSPMVVVEQRGPPCCGCGRLSKAGALCEPRTSWRATRPRWLVFRLLPSQRAWLGDLQVRDLLAEAAVRRQPPGGPPSSSSAAPELAGQPWEAWLGVGGRTQGRARVQAALPARVLMDHRERAGTEVGARRRGGGRRRDMGRPLRGGLAQGSAAASAP